MRHFPVPSSKVRGPRSVEKTAGARAAIVDVRSGLLGFARQIAGGASRTEGLGLGFWETARGAEVWITIEGVTAPNPQAPRATANKASPP